MASSTVPRPRDLLVAAGEQEENHERAGPKSGSPYLIARELSNRPLSLFSAPNAKKPPTLAGGGRESDSIRNSYFLTWYTRSPASVFVDSIFRPCFLAAVERKPRTL